MTGQRFIDNALVRLRAAMLDLTAAGRHTDANDVRAIIERIEPPLRGEAAGSGLPAARAGGSEAVAVVPPAATPPATTYAATMTRSTAPVVGWRLPCSNCGHKMAEHCTVHLLPCCPGSLMHGGDEGSWTP